MKLIALLIGMALLWGVRASAQCSPVVWQNAVNVTVATNNLTKSAGGAAWNAGASSTVAFNSGGICADFQTSETTLFKELGIGNSDPDQGFTSIRWSWNFTDTGLARVVVIESGSPVVKWETDFGGCGPNTINTGDVFRITATASGPLEFWRKPSGGAYTLCYTTATSLTYPALVDTSLYSPSSTLTNVEWGNVYQGCGGVNTPTPTNTATPIATNTPTIAVETPTRRPTFPGGTPPRCG